MNKETGTHAQNKMHPAGTIKLIIIIVFINLCNVLPSTIGGLCPLSVYFYSCDCVVLGKIVSKDTLLDDYLRGKRMEIKYDYQHRFVPIKILHKTTNISTDSIMVLGHPSCNPLELGKDYLLFLTTAAFPEDSENVRKYHNYYYIYGARDILFDVRHIKNQFFINTSQCKFELDSMLSKDKNKSFFHRDTLLPISFFTNAFKILKKDQSKIRYYYDFNKLEWISESDKYSEYYKFKANYDFRCKYNQIQESDKPVLLRHLDSLKKLEK